MATMRDAALFRRVWKTHGLAAALIKALARLAGRHVLIEGVDEEFPRPPPPRDLSMPTMDDARAWHVGYGGRWKHVLPLPNDRMMLHIGAQSVDNFFFVADAWAQLLTREIGPGSHVMDVGCGCGRTARLLVNNPYVVRYTGFDVFAPYIEWCNRFFGELHGERFHFHHLDVRTARYNPAGALAADAVRFPAADSDVDVLYAASLFTHLYPRDAAAYLRETRRVLRDGGTALASFHDRPAAGEAFSGDEHRADYDAAHFSALCAQAGLDLAEDVGDVCGQRTFVLRKAPSAPVALTPPRPIT
jgi:SAM-dependent methyltransferase